uniref:Uncharacterized protein n=1 Tax=Anguilla anguilla TaxID=7936 RepID=A0A0E9QR89_ANGAN
MFHQCCVDRAGLEIMAPFDPLSRACGKLRNHYRETTVTDILSVNLACLLSAPLHQVIYLAKKKATSDKK